jgi:molecular chaperone HtpG
MLVNESVENLLPRWAFFVRCVLDASTLRPLASREAFYEETDLLNARDALGAALRSYLLKLSTNSPRQLTRIVELHGMSMKGLAIDDDEFFGAIIDLLRFETTYGRMSFGEFQTRARVVHYAPTVDVYRQVSTLAAARGIGVINAGYTYELPLMQKAERLYAHLNIEAIDPIAFANALTPVDIDSAPGAAELVLRARRAIGMFDCDVEVRNFEPAEVASFYARDDDADFLMNLHRVRESANPLLAGMLDDLEDEVGEPERARLCLNWSCPLVRRVASVDDEDVVETISRLLYVQALMLGNHPLGPQELDILNTGLSELIELVSGPERWMQ